MTKILPQKKRNILHFLEEYIEERGYAPTLQDIAKHFKLSSLSTVHEHLQYLESHRFIKRNGREIEILYQETSKRSERKKHQQDTTENSRMLPIVGLITAGAPIEAIEHQEDTIAVPHELSTDDAFILKVKGDSMIESMIADGDYVIIKKQSTAQNGEIVVALLEDGSATLKEYYKEKNHIRLQPRNRKYEPLIVQNVTIQGKVTGVMRSFL